MRRFPMHYAAYGLRVRSPVPLPASSCRMRASAPDVTVRLGVAPATLNAVVRSNHFAGRWPEWEAAPGRFLLRAQGVARYLVTEGRDILVEPRGGSDREIGAHFATPAWTALLLQRGILSFHASAVAFEGGAVLFLGPSGAGKSSLLGALLKRGHAMLADDVTGVSAGAFLRGASASSADSRLLALPAWPHLRLRADALDALGWRGQAIEQAERSDKHLAPVWRFHASPLPIRALCLLNSHSRSGIEIETVRNNTTLAVLRRQVLLKRLAHGLGRRRDLFRVLTAMVRRIPIVRVTRPAHSFCLNALAERVEAHLRETILEKDEAGAPRHHTVLPA